MPYRNPEDARKNATKWYRANSEHALATAKKRYIREFPFFMLKNAKVRALKAGVPFNLELQDIVIPEFCPILGMKLEHGTHKSHDNAPTLDRIIPSQGYVRGNVIVVSHRANRIKSDASLAELQNIVSWLMRLKG